MREMYHELYEVKKQRKLPIKWMAPEAIYEQIFTSKSDVYVLFLTYDTAEYNTDFKCTRNLKIPLIWVCVAAWGFLCVYGIYKHNFGVLRILSPVMVIFQNVTKHFSHCKICQDQTVMFSFDFIPSTQNLNEIKLLSSNEGHDLS